MFGGSLEWLNVGIGHIYPVLCIILSSILIYKNSQPKFKISLSNRIIIIAVTVATIGLIFTSLYVQWTPVRNSTIGGIQGRYFLPIFLLAPAIALSLRKTSSSISAKTENHNYIYLFSVFYSIAAITALVCAHI